MSTVKNSQAKTIDGFYRHREQVAEDGKPSIDGCCTEAFRETGCFESIRFATAETLQPKVPQDPDNGGERLLLEIWTTVVCVAVLEVFLCKRTDCRIAAVVSGGGTPH